MKKTIRSIALVSIGALALAACSGSNETNQVSTDTNVSNVIETPVEPAPLETNQVIDTVDPVVNAAPVPQASRDTVSDAQQTADDADATGLTSRVDRGTTDESGQPAQ
jgi:ABC-type glycerol-3-phosphate transport system substrate-binding protein